MITLISFLSFTSIVAIVAWATTRTRYQGFNYTKLPMKTFTLETIPVELVKLTKKQVALLDNQ